MLATALLPPLLQPPPALVTTHYCPGHLAVLSRALRCSEDQCTAVQWRSIYWWLVYYTIIHIFAPECPHCSAVEMNSSPALQEVARRAQSNTSSVLRHTSVGAFLSPPQHLHPPHPRTLWSNTGVNKYQSSVYLLLVGKYSRETGVHRQYFERRCKWQNNLMNSFSSFSKSLARFLSLKHSWIS